MYRRPSVKYVFVAAMPKSGTTLVAGLLDRVPNVAAQHEYIGREPGGARSPFLQLSWYAGRRYAVPYLRRVKRRVEEEFDSECFADVSGHLQRAVPYLEEVFEPERIFHLVRDPRDQVRSLVTHRSEVTDRQMPLLPAAASDMERWLDGDKFSHICLQWAETTRLLVEQGAHLVRMEDLVSDYAYFRRELLDPCGMELSKDAWRDQVSTKVNAMPSRPYRFLSAKLKGKTYVADSLPSYEEWPADRQRELIDVCGEAMALVGYHP
jgi:hypothetical protein